MQIFNITAVTFAAMATASPVDTGTANPPSPILPSTMPPYEWPMPPSESPMPPSGVWTVSDAPISDSLASGASVPFRSCLQHNELIGSTAKCNAEIMQNGLNFAANLACFISAVASGVASSIDMCKHCIPKTIVVEPQTVEE
ncbi:hypothetical protein E4U37_000448 [Claviceps purpurea]|nr:hypothetical protein E4U37_000448 [Claviceps purpurea]